MTPEDSKRLAKNTLYMYLRMAVSLILGLYASRVLLRMLGADDFGTFNLIGSIIAVVEMLRSMFTSAIQRYLNLEIGRGNFKRLQLVFNMSLFINLIIGVLFILSVEIVGLWFFEYKINIAPQRMFAARVSFQIYILISLILLVTAVYEAIVIAKERMTFFAFNSIADSCLKLIIILLTPLFCNDNLIVYSLLLLVETIIIRSVIVTYCYKRFPECKLKKVWDKDLFKQMFAFASWQLLGNGANTITTNGLNMILNVFGGTLVNAARGIAYKMQTALFSFLDNIYIAITPYSFQAFAQGKREDMYNMLYFSSKLFLLIGFCIYIPFVYLTEEVLQLWLGQVVPYSIRFVQITMLCAIIHSVHQPLDTVFKAVGKIKYYQIAEGIVMLLPMFASYLILKNNGSLYLAFAMPAVFELINLIIISLIARRTAGMNFSRYVKAVFLPMLFYLFIGFVGFAFIEENNCTFFSKALILILIEIIAILFAYFATLNYKERLTINNLVETKIKKKKE